MMIFNIISKIQDMYKNSIGVLACDGEQDLVSWNKQTNSG